MKRIAIFGLSANPAGRNHRAVAQILSQEFDEVIVVPCGGFRSDKPSVNDIDPVYRAAMLDMTFRGIPKVKIDYYDFENRTFTRTQELDTRYRHLGQLYHYVGSDIIIHGSKSQSQIHTTWHNGKKLWQTLQFVTIKRVGYELAKADYPPNCLILDTEIAGSSSDIRQRVQNHQPIDDLVMPKVATYIERYSLYRGSGYTTEGILSIDRPKIKLLPAALEDTVGNYWIGKIMDESLKPDCPYSLTDDGYEADLLVRTGGDGSMLGAAKENWQYRTPIFGLKTGHEGFLSNAVTNGTPLGELFKNLRVYQVPLLSVDITLETGEMVKTYALNEAWVKQSENDQGSLQAAWLRLTIDEELWHEKIVGNGLLVTTAAGSTGLAYHMGCAPYPVGTQMISLVGDCVIPSDFNHRAISLEQNSLIEIENLDPDKRPILTVCDSKNFGRTKKAKITASSVAAVELAFLPEAGLRTKLRRLQKP